MFGVKLTKTLKESKITMYRLAKDLGYSKSTVTNWCNNFCEPKASDIAKIAIYLDVSADYLLGLEDDLGNKTYINNSFNNFNNSGSFKI